MSAPLRLLIVEDSEEDAFLLMRELQRAGYAPQFERVDSAAAMQVALERQPWDVVIGDYSMPHFSGTAALALLRERDPDTPFIFVSGTIGEDIAVEAMKAGAQDYLIKGQLRRLIPAVERELRDAHTRRERRRAELALQEAEQRFAKVFEASPVGIAISTLDDARFLDVNAAFLRMVGYTREEVVGRTAFDISLWPEPADRARVIDQLVAGSAQELETSIRAKDGSLRSVLASLERIEIGGTACLLALVHDVTKSRLLEQQLRLAQRMEAVGRLAGGVAHDFNNLLTVITSYSELLLEDLGGADPMRGDVDQIRKAAQSAATLTHQLLAFSRRQVLEPMVLDVNATVASTEKLLKRLIGEDVQLATSLRPDLGMVKVDPGQLEQIIMNLAVNARDAMPRGGRLTIETANVELDEAYVQEHPLARLGSYVMLAVSDTGLGMDEETKAHIFEPFFTTKATGHGTGLGLATVYGIVKQSGGFIWVYSELGHGTSLKIYLPRVEQPADHRAVSPTAAEPARGTETVLLVEDEASVRTVTRQVLQRYGYTVLEAPNGETALRLALKHHGAIELLVTDVVMPGLSGRTLANQLAGLRPHIKVCYTSGYTDDAIVRHGMLEPGIAYLQKPFTPDGLARKVREVLDSP